MMPARFIEEIGRSLGDARHRSDVVAHVATGGRRESSCRVQAVDEGDVRHPTASLVRLGSEEQPRYRLGIRYEGGQLGPHHLAAVLRFPGWTRVVLADDMTSAVEQLRLRCRKDPGEAGR